MNNIRIFQLVNVLLDKLVDTEGLIDTIVWLILMGYTLDELTYLGFTHQDINLANLIIEEEVEYKWQKNKL